MHEHVQHITDTIHESSTAGAQWRSQGVAKRYVIFIYAIHIFPL